MNGNINNIRLSFACDENWDRMRTEGNGRHCEKCQKKIYDFTDTKQQEFLQILAEHNNNVCGRFRTDQMVSSHLYMPAWKRWTQAALFLIGINLFNYKAEAQNIKIKPVDQHTKHLEPEMTVGIPMPMNMATFPGGDEALSNFLSKNIQYKKGAIDGKVYAQFTVGKNGSVTGIKIIRGLNPVNDMEVVRVLKLSPKWKPARNGGIATACVYTLPVSFAKK